MYICLMKKILFGIYLLFLINLNLNAQDTTSNKNIKYDDFIAKLDLTVAPIISSDSGTAGRMHGIAINGYFINGINYKAGFKLGYNRYNFVGKNYPNQQNKLILGISNVFHSPISSFFIEFNSILWSKPYLFSFSRTLLPSKLKISTLVILFSELI